MIDDRYVHAVFYRATTHQVTAKIELMTMVVNSRMTAP
jgi:hypothetical protein